MKLLIKIFLISTVILGLIGNYNYLNFLDLDIPGSETPLRLCLDSQTAETGCDAAIIRVRQGENPREILEKLLNTEGPVWLLMPEPLPQPVSHQICAELRNKQQGYYTCPAEEDCLCSGGVYRVLAAENEPLLQFPWRQILSGMRLHPFFLGGKGKIISFSDECPEELAGDLQKQGYKIWCSITSAKNSRMGNSSSSSGFFPNGIFER